MPDPAPTARTAALTRILVIDDEKGLRDFLNYELTELGYSVESAADGEEGLRKLKTGDFGLVISDVRMPGMDGIALLEEIKRTDQRLEVVLTTGYGTVETAVDAMKRGAFDFLLKPIETERLALVVRRALEAGELKALVALYESSLTLFRTVEFDEVLPVIVSMSRRLLAADRAVIAILDEDGRLKIMADTSGASRDDAFRDLIGAVCADACGGACRGICAQRPVSDAGRRLATGTAGARSLLIQPLTVGGKTLGCLTAARALAGEPFTALDQQHATIFASQAAQAVRNAELFRRLQTTQDSLVQSEKLNAMGRVVAGIAHEINNPLAVILGNSEMMLEGGRLNAEDRVDLQDVVAHARRCRDVVRNLLEFAARREPKREPLDLVPLAESALTIALYGWNEPIAIVRDWPKDSPRVLADSVQIKQVVVNLVRNALQAAEGRRDNEVAVRIDTLPGRARIRVEDRGPGLTAQAQARLFEPFFTTKAPGKGTGLGLYLCRLLIERHGGSITATNREGGGASFVIELPIP